MLLVQGYLYLCTNITNTTGSSCSSNNSNSLASSNSNKTCLAMERFGLAGLDQVGCWSTISVVEVCFETNAFSSILTQTPGIS